METGNFLGSPAGRKIGSASSWLRRDGKLPNTPPIPSFEASEKTPGGFGHAEFSARDPRPRFRAILMIFGGSKILEKSPGRANYLEAPVDILVLPEEGDE